MKDSHTRLRDWEEEFREYFDKALKPKKPTMKNLDRELCVNFIKNLLSTELESIRKEVIREILETIESMEHFKKCADPTCTMSAHDAYQEIYDTLKYNNEI